MQYASSPAGPIVNGDATRRTGHYPDNGKGANSMSKPSFRIVDLSPQLQAKIKLARRLTGQTNRAILEMALDALLREIERRSAKYPELWIPGDNNDEK